MRLHRVKAFEYYASRNTGALLTLMHSLSPTSAVMLNLELALVHP